MISRVPSRMLRDAADVQEHAEDLAEFVVLLLDALEIPEVRDRVRDALDTHLARPEPPGRRPGRGRR